MTDQISDELKKAIEYVLDHADFDDQGPLGFAYPGEKMSAAREQLEKAVGRWKEKGP